MSLPPNWRPIRETEYLRERPIAEHENAAMNVITQTPEMGEGVPVPSAQSVAWNGGWLVRNQNPADTGYTGDNAPWRK